jgi:hypothetical protein
MMGNENTGESGRLLFAAHWLISLRLHLDSCYFSRKPAFTLDVWHLPLHLVVGQASAASTLFQVAFNAPFNAHKLTIVNTGFTTNCWLVSCSITGYPENFTTEESA